MIMWKELTIIFAAVLGSALCNAEDSLKEYRKALQGKYSASGSRPYPSFYTYYPNYRTDEIKKPHASDMFLIEGGVYWPHDTDDSYSSLGSYAGYGNNYAAYRPYELGGYYSNRQGRISIGSESAASSVPSEDDKDYNEDNDFTESNPETSLNIPTRRSPLREYVLKHYDVGPTR